MPSSELDWMFEELDEIENKIKNFKTATNHEPSTTVRGLLFSITGGRDAHYRFMDLYLVVCDSMYEYKSFRDSYV